MSCPRLAAAVLSVTLAALLLRAAWASPGRPPVPVREVGEEKQRPRGGQAGGGRKPEQPAAGDDGDPHLTPRDAVRWSLADATNLPADLNPAHVRFVSLYNVPPSRRRTVWLDVAFAVNSISRSRRLVIPPVIPGTENSLVRIDLDDYYIDPAEWDRLATLGSGRAPFPDPYFSQFVVRADHAARKEEKQPPAGEWVVRKVHKEDPPGVKWYDQYHRPIMVDRRTWVPGKADSPAVPTPGKKELRPAVWLGQNDQAAPLHALVALTRTTYPVLRADWFVTYALWAPRYYDLLGLGKKIEDFQKLVRVRDREDADRKVAGIVVKPPRNSRVALNNRFITFAPSTNIPQGAYYWETHDTKKSVDNRQYMNVLLDFVKFERGLSNLSRESQDFFDATEDIGVLPNGLQAYFLTDGKGNRLDKADADVAIDKTSSYQDAQVWCARNCITCHIEGIRPVEDSVRDFSRDKIGLLVVNDDKQRTNSRLVEDFFGYDLEVLQKSNTATYQATIQAVTKGRTAAENATAFMDLTAGYLDDGVTLEVAAWEVGVPAPKLRQALSRGIGLDPTLTGLLKTPPAAIRRDQWEVSSFPQIMVFLESYRN
jgi:hypothetical protein